MAQWLSKIAKLIHLGALRPKGHDITPPIQCTWSTTPECTLAMNRDTSKPEMSQITSTIMISSLFGSFYNIAGGLKQRQTAGVQP